MASREYSPSEELLLDLHAACNRCDLRWARQCLDLGADPNAPVLRLDGSVESLPALWQTIIVAARDLPRRRETMALLASFGANPSLECSNPLDGFPPSPFGEAFRDANIDAARDFSSIFPPERLASASQAVSILSALSTQGSPAFSSAAAPILLPLLDALGETPAFPRIPMILTARALIGDASFSSTPNFSATLPAAALFRGLDEFAAALALREREPQPPLLPLSAPGSPSSGPPPASLLEMLHLFWTPEQFPRSFAAAEAMAFRNSLPPAERKPSRPGL